MPKPNKNEDKDKFIERCMSDDIMNKKYSDEKQRFAACDTQFDMKMGDIRIFSEMQDLLNSGYEEVNNLEIFNIYPNSHNLTFTEDDLKEIIKMFEEFGDSDTPNIKLSHSSQQAVLKELFNMNDIPYEELPSLGYLKNFRIKDKSIYADAEKVPTKLKPLLFDGKLFKTVSPELIRNYRGTGKKYIKAISLTNNPSLKHISDVHMGEALRFDGNIILKGDTIMADKVQEEVQLSEGAISKLVDKFSDFFKKKDEAEAPKIADEKQEEKVNLSEVQLLKQDFEKQLNDLKLKLVEKETEQKNFSEQIEKINENARLQEAELICKTALQDGVPKVVIEHFRPVLMSEVSNKTILMSEEVDGEKMEAQKPIKDFVKGFFKAYPDKVDFSDRTKTDFSAPSDDKQKNINARTKDLMSEGLSKHEALMQAGVEILGG